MHKLYDYEPNWIFNWNTNELVNFLSPSRLHCDFFSAIFHRQVSSCHQKRFDDLTMLILVLHYYVDDRDTPCRPTETFKWRNDSVRRSGISNIVIAKRWRRKGAAKPLHFPLIVVSVFSNANKTFICHFYAWHGFHISPKIPLDHLANYSDFIHESLLPIFPVD